MSLMGSNDGLERTKRDLVSKSRWNLFMVSWNAESFRFHLKLAF